MEQTRTDNLVAAFAQLQSNDLLSEVWNKPKSTLGTILCELEQCLGVDLSIQWFRDPYSNFDFKDVLTIEITREQFRRRLSNSILRKSFKLRAPPHVTLAEFVKAMRRQYKQPQTDCSSRCLSLKGVLQQPPPSWVSLFIRVHRSALKAAFTHLARPSKVLSADQAKHFICQAMNVFRLTLTDVELSSCFQQLCHPEYTFKALLHLLQVWASTTPLSTYGNLLEQTALEFLVTPKLPGITLYPELSEFARAYKAKKRMQKHDSSEVQQALQTVFHFYAKAAIKFGLKASFLDIESHNTSLNVEKFTKFCRDFGLLEQKELLTSETVVGIFKRTAENGKQMNFVQFEDALALLADAYVNVEYDAKYCTSLACKTIGEKREVFYKILKLHRPKLYLKKLKGFGLPFSSDKETRITGLKYQFKMNASQKQALEAWKTQRAIKVPPQEVTRSSSRPLKRLFRTPKLGYSNKSASASRKLQQLTFRTLDTQPGLSTPYLFTHSTERDEVDDYLEQLYGAVDSRELSSKHTAALAAHDFKVARGLKVLLKDSSFTRR